MRRDLRSLYEKIWKSNHIQMKLQRQHFLLSYFKTLSNGPAGVELATSRRVAQCSISWATGSNPSMNERKLIDLPIYSFYSESISYVCSDFSTTSSTRTKKEYSHKLNVQHMTTSATSEIFANDAWKEETSTGEAQSGQASWKISILYLRSLDHSW